MAANVSPLMGPKLDYLSREAAASIDEATHHKRWSGWAMVEDMFDFNAVAREGLWNAGGAHSQVNRVARQLDERSPETLGFEARAERDLMLVLHRPIEPTAKSARAAADELSGAAQEYLS
jgi:hypothetical protein